MASTDAIPVPRKNTAFRWTFAIRKPSDATLITTWAGMDSEVSLDGGSFSDCTNEATEIGTSGVGYIDLTAAEMNADCVVLKVTVTNTGAVPLVFVFYPESAGDYRIDTTNIDAIKARTDNLPTDPADQSAVEAAITAATSGLATPADVNAQVLDVLTTDTFAELAAVPAATSSLKDKLVYVFQWLRNKSTQTSSQRKLYADDGSTVVATETVSDDGTTYTKGEAS